MILRKATLHLLLAFLFFSTIAAAGETSRLMVDGDLMIHPDQVAGFFAIASQKVTGANGWNWDELSFTKPFRTKLTAVAAKGPFQVSFDTKNLAKQEAAFELTWVNPMVTVQHFEVNDTITRNVGGHHIVINLNGACSNMSISTLNGMWKIKGSLKWSWAEAGLQVKWQDFQFDRNENAVIDVDLGQCSGPLGLQEELRKAVTVISQDSDWMRDMLQEGVLDWLETSLGSLQEELMRTREIEVKQGLFLAWHPLQLEDAHEGRVRVSGQLVLSKESNDAHEEVLLRSFTREELSQTTESGFVLPKDTLQKVVEFLYRNGELGYRVSSKDVGGFQSLMRSRFLQFFLWPDLMNFSKSTQFWFDVTSEQAPKLDSPRMQSQGLTYQFQAPLIVHQWAPTATKYLPYVDFRSQLNGALSTKIEKGAMKLRLEPGRLQIRSNFRSEFSIIRRIRSWISTSILSSRVAEYLREKDFQVEVPAWEIGEDMTLGMSHLKVSGQSLRVLLDFKSNK